MCSTIAATLVVPDLLDSRGNYQIPWGRKFAFCNLVVAQPSLRKYTDRRCCILGLIALVFSEFRSRRETNP